MRKEDIDPNSVKYIEKEFVPEKFEIKPSGEVPDETEDFMKFIKSNYFSIFREYLKILLQANSSFLNYYWEVQKKSN
ncbi:MAG: hypothetical protein KDK36_19080 [Leptospiraceae bacterium]|nr:hypothetical protein [Leptospiraceae bacterium]